MRGLPYIAAFVLVASSAAAQIDPRTALLERTAWEALADGQAHAAAEAFREAIAADPKNARLLLGAATAATLERRDADAQVAAERALSIDPSLRDAQVLLGQIRYRLKDLPGAIGAYEAVLADPSDRDRASVRELTATLGRWRRELALHERMQQAIANHFAVSFEGPEEAALAAKAVEALDRAYWRVGEVFGVYLAAPTAVVLYTTEQFTDITRSPSWAAGAYDGVIRVPMRGALDRPDELDRVMAHEFTHALIRTLAPRGVPAWLNEGLAAALDSASLEWANAHVAAATPVPLRALGSGFGRFSGRQAALAYATSALAAQRLLDQAGGVAVANLLRDLGDDAVFESAFLRRIQRPFADFQASLF